MSRILVVDDDRDLAGLLAVDLQRRGHAVELAANGREALQRLQRMPFDVVLVDWHMPVMDGAAFLQEYRRATASSSPPVVVMSGAPEALARALSLGAARVIAKPFRFEELGALLGQLTSTPKGEAGDDG
jgi:DNA-binding response OmpR family regulator